MSEYSESTLFLAWSAPLPDTLATKGRSADRGCTRRRPYSGGPCSTRLKGTSRVFDILLQVLDDGPPDRWPGPHRGLPQRHPDSDLEPRFSVPGQPDLPFEERSEKALEVVHQAFRPEFLNRLDDIIMFQPLSAENLGQIVGLQIKSMAKRLEDRRLSLNVTPAALGGWVRPATTRRSVPARCAAWYSARLATAWLAASSPALFTTVTP